MCALTLRHKVLFSGVAGEIIRDEAVRNALMSTQRVRSPEKKQQKMYSKSVYIFSKMCQGVFSGNISLLQTFWVMSVES